MTNEPIRILIADDSADFRQGLKDLLRTAEQFKVVAEAASGDEAVTRAAESQPDVVLMDLNMPGVNGIEGARRITETSPHIAVLMLSMLEDDDSVLAAMRAGARGYILKGAPRAEIVRTVEAATEGSVIFGPSVARRILERLNSADRPQPNDAPFPELTNREREILSLVAKGQNNNDIAAALFLSPKTVRNHVHSLYHKLQVEGRSEAIVRAREAGLGRTEDPQ